MPKSFFKITRYVGFFLFSYVALIFLFSELPRPFNMFFIFAMVAIFSFAAVFFLDMTVPFFNLLNPVPVRLPKHYKQSVMLTFDDGPSKPYTLEIMDILDRFNVKATFFCIGENIEKNPDVIVEMYRRGHSIGNHSFRHVIFPFLKPDRIREEIIQTSNMIQKITGQKEKWFRFPKGFQSRKGFSIARKLGVVPIGFSYPIYDVENPPAQQLIDRTLKKVKAGDILLMHDGYPTFKPGSRSSLVEALPEIIQGILDKGLRFVTPEEVFTQY